ncbi:MAG: hypothetical protein VX770_07435 [Candidatus Neomarinimicrobiota bacterium]|jgi:hypothetical protein|nr:hypothetical protein [Candidatus Neomarinimicrobiota bacterium]
MLYKILYERYATYSDGSESRRASIENIESGSLEELLDNIHNNQKYLNMREDDIIDYSKSEDLEETGLNIIFIKDDTGKNVYSRDNTSDITKNSTIIINTYLGGDLYGDKANIQEVKKRVINQIETIQNIFRNQIKKIEILVGDCVCYFGESRPEVMSQTTFKTSEINNLETIIKNNLEEKIISSGGKVNEFIEDGLFCFNYYIPDDRFRENYDYLHKLMPALLEIVKVESSFFHLFHIPSNEYLDIDETPDIEGSESILDDFIKYVE